MTSAPTGWTQLRRDEEVSNINGANLYIYYKVASSEPASWTWDVDDGGGGNISSQVWICAAYSGVDTTTPIDVHDGTVADDLFASWDAPSVTTSNDDSLVVFLWTTSGATLASSPYTYTLPGSVTKRAEVDNQEGTGASIRSAAVGDESFASAGATGTRNATTDQGNLQGWSGASVALAPASAGTPIAGSDSATLTETASLDVTITAADSATVTEALGDRTFDSSDSVTLTDTSAVVEIGAGLHQLIVDRGLQVIGGRASNTADSFDFIQTLAVDDSSTVFSVEHTNLLSPANVYDQGFDTTPTRSGQTITHTSTIPTGSGNFVIRRVSLHNAASGSVTGSSDTLVAGIDSVNLTKTSDFTLEIQVDVTHT